MAIRIKKELEKRLEPILAEKGFIYDSSMTRPGNPAWMYARGGPFPSPDREEICVTKHRFGPFISVDLRSTPKRAFKDLGYLAGENNRNGGRSPPKSR